MISFIIGIVILTVIAIVSLSRDIEGEWIELNTGHKYVVTSNPAGGFISKCDCSSKTQSFYTRIWDSKIRNRHTVIGKYDRWRGRIQFGTTKWRRMTCLDRNHISNWYRLKNLIRTPDVYGFWYGSFGKSPVTIRLLKGEHDDCLTGTIRVGDSLIQNISGTFDIVSRKIKFRNVENGEQYEMTWDGQYSSTLKIYNTDIIVFHIE